MTGKGGLIIDPGHGGMIASMRPGRDDREGVGLVFGLLWGLLASMRPGRDDREGGPVGAHTHRRCLALQ